MNVFSVSIECAHSMESKFIKEIKMTYVEMTEGIQDLRHMAGHLEMVRQ